MIPFWGIVEDINDPLKLGRVRVRVFGVHSADLIKSDIAGIPTNELPWATVACPTTGAAVNGIGESPRLLNSTQVTGFFRDTAMQAPVITHVIPGVPDSLPDTSKGFNDPNGIYPKEDYLNESDINRLARNENIDETIVQTKKDDRTTGVTTSTSTWDQPEIPYAATYPYNQVKESESGHIEEIDDTPSNERTHRYHKTGTFEEIDKDGTKVVKVVKDNYVIVYGDDYAYIKGNCNVTIDGDATLYIKGDYNEKIDGNVNQVIGGNRTVTIGGTETRTSAGNMADNAPRIDHN